MNRARAKQLLPIIKAFSEGKDIEFLDTIANEWKSNIDPNQIGFYGNVIYRIKPSDKPRTIEDGLEVGDIIVAGDAVYKYRIMGVCGEIVFISMHNNHKLYYKPTTMQRILEGNWKLECSETLSSEVEVTIEEIAKLKGVDVDQIRIKD